MKNNNALWAVVAVLVIAVVGTAVYFGNTQTQKGSLFATTSTPTTSSKWTKIFESKSTPAGAVTISQSLFEGDAVTMVASQADFKVVKQYIHYDGPTKVYRVENFVCDHVNYNNGGSNTLECLSPVMPTDGPGPGPAIPTPGKVMALDFINGWATPERSGPLSIATEIVTLFVAK